MIRYIFLYSLLIWTAAGFSQNLQKELRSLDQDFKSFKYEQVLQKGAFLLGDAYVTTEDSLAIYQYMLSSAYALNDSLRARQIILDLLDHHPDFALNTKNTSPKIVEFFNLIKKEHRQNFYPSQTPADTLFFSKHVKENLLSHISAPVLLSGVLFPGTAHLLSGQRQKGYLFSAGTVGLLSGLSYYIYQTDKKRKAYMNAGPKASFNSLYKAYNTSYQMRTVFALAYGLWSLYGLYDLHSTFVITPAFQPQNEEISLLMRYNW